MRTENQWIRYFEKSGVLWTHDGNPKSPHALLTSGMHSDRFFNTRRITEDPIFFSQICQDLALILYQEVGDEINGINWVVGPAIGAVIFAYELARQINLRREKNAKPCLTTYVEKTDRGLVFPRTKILEGDVILIVEDVITTGATLKMATQATTLAGGMVFPRVVTLINRSGSQKCDDRKIVALVNQPIRVWSSEDCPLCKAGSKAVHPKNNWTELIRRETFGDRARARIFSGMVGI